MLCKVMLAKSITKIIIFWAQGNRHVWGEVKDGGEIPDWKTAMGRGWGGKK